MEATVGSPFPPLFFSYLLKKGQKGKKKPLKGLQGLNRVSPILYVPREYVPLSSRITGLLNTLIDYLLVKNIEYYSTNQSRERTKASGKQKRKKARR